MPYKSRFRHEWWSVDIRYIEHHDIPEIGGYIYQINILENYSRAILASKLSTTQTQWDYLEVLFEALSKAGVPKGIVSDGGGQFYSNQAMDAYRLLDILNERIEYYIVNRSSTTITNATGGTRAARTRDRDAVSLSPVVALRRGRRVAALSACTRTRSFPSSAS